VSNTAACNMVQMTGFSPCEYWKEYTETVWTFDFNVILTKLSRRPKCFYLPVRPMVGSRGSIEG